MPLGDELPLVFGEAEDAGEKNIVKLMRAWMSSLQGVEYALQQMSAQSSVDKAVGAQLDIIGKKVGQKRAGLGDNIYRRYIRARIAANRSKGRGKDVINVARLAIDDAEARYHIHHVAHAAFALRVEDVATPNDVAVATIDVLGDATTGGVRVALESCTAEPPLWLLLDDPTRTMDSTCVAIDARSN